MKEPKFNNKNGDLTKYSFLCGYVQKVEKDGKYKVLFMEHRHYHIQSGKEGERREVWETFEGTELTKARKFFNNIKL